MKTISFIKNNLLAVAAAVVAISTMSFKVIGEKYAGTLYYYNNPATSGFNDTSRWSTTDPGQPCAADGDRPCKVLVPEGQTLNDVIGGQTDFSILNSISDGKKD